MKTPRSAEVVKTPTGGHWTFMPETQIIRKRVPIGGFDGFFDRTGMALGAGGSLFGGMQNATVRPDGSWLGKNGRYYRAGWGGNQHTGGRSGAIRTAGLYQNAARGVAVVSVGFTVVDVVSSRQINASHALNLGVTAVSGIPVFGWMVGGAYFLTDLTVRGITGTSIGGHLDNAVGRPIISW